jgi:biotin carboxyl carrier protein
MLRAVRKFLKNNSPDWLNTEVNKDLLQNLSANITASKKTITSTSYDVNCSPRPHLGEGLGVRAKTQPASKQSTLLDSDRPISIEKCLQFPTPGTPHWRRIRQVFQALDNAPFNASYNQLIEYVREATGKGCSRKLISKWKKQKLNSNIPDNNSGDRHIEERTAAISASPTIIDIPSTVSSLHLAKSSNHSTNKKSLSTDNWSLMTVLTAGIMVSLVGCEIIPFNNRPSENIAIASVTAPITPLTPIPERRKNRLEPRNIKIELTLSNPQDLKIKPGDKISAGQVLSDRVSERNRLQAKKKQLQLSLEKLNLPLTPIPQPKPIPEIAELPPVSYAEEEAAIKLKQQKLTEAQQAIALQQKKIDSIEQLKTNKNPNNMASPEFRGTEGDQKKGSTPNLKLILEHERANLANLEAAKQEAQIQLEVAQSKLTTAKEQRAYIEYQRQLEQTRRAIAIEQRNQAIASQESERERLLAEREYSKAQIETQIQTLDHQIEQLSTVKAPYEGTIKKIKWTGQSDHNLTAVVTLAVDGDHSTIANSTGKPTPTTEVRETREEDK